MTMIELLVGMGVISIIFVGLGYVFEQAMRTTNVGDAQGQVHQQARAVFRYLAEELRGLPRDGRLVITSPNGALTRWNVTVYGDVLAFITATPQHIRRSTQLDPITHQNLAGVCYYRWHRHNATPQRPLEAWEEALYRLTDRLDTGGTIQDLSLVPLDPAPEEDQLAVRVVTPRKGTILPQAAFEVEVYNAATGVFVPVADASEGLPGTLEIYDSATRGLPRAIRVRLRLVDRMADHGSPYLRDDVRGERGLEFQETFWLPAAQ